MASSEVVEIAACATTTEAVQIRDALADHGVSALIDTTAAASIGVLGGARVLVPSCDATRAKAIIESLPDDSENSDKPWFCGKCKEVVDGDFDVCWSCGNARVEVEQHFPLAGSEQDFQGGSGRGEFSDLQQARASGNQDVGPAQMGHAGTSNANSHVEMAEDQARLIGADSSEQPLAGSSRQDDTNPFAGVLLVVSGLFILLAQITRLLGSFRLLADLCALIAVVAGIRKIIAANRLERVRRGDAGPADLWKQARQAEQEQDFAQAFRLYGEIVKCHPATTWGEDAKSSIELLRKEGKIG